jgi:hypothetical protein
MRKKGQGRKKTMHGKGFFGDMWSGIKNVAPAVGRFIKDNNLVSKGLSLVGQDGLANTAKSIGLGRRRKRGARKIRGSGGFGINLPFGGLNVGWGKMRGGAMVNSVTSSVAPSAIRV